MEIKLAKEKMENEEGLNYVLIQLKWNEKNTFIKLIYIIPNIVLKA
ncbi:hypothetical protein STZ1_20760 [Bacillus subtilis]